MSARKNFVFKGRDLKTIRDLEKALQRIGAMDERNAAYNNTHAGLQKVMFLSNTLTQAVDKLTKRIESAIMQIYATAQP